MHLFEDQPFDTNYDHATIEKYGLQDFVRLTAEARHEADGYELFCAWAGLDPRSFASTEAHYMFELTLAPYSRAALRLRALGYEGRYPTPGRSSHRHRGRGPAPGGGTEGDSDGGQGRLS